MFPFERIELHGSFLTTAVFLGENSFASVLGMRLRGFSAATEGWLSEALYFSACFAGDTGFTPDGFTFTLSLAGIGKQPTTNQWMRTDNVCSSPIHSHSEKTKYPWKSISLQKQNKRKNTMVKILRKYENILKFHQQIFSIISQRYTLLVHTY